MKKPGRPKGSLNKRSKALRQAVQSGMTPLEYLLSVMHDENNETPLRMDAAKSAAGYCHPRLATIDMNHDVQVQVTKIERTIVKAEDTNR